MHDECDAHNTHTKTRDTRDTRDTYVTRDPHDALVRTHVTNIMEMAALRGVRWCAVDRGGGCKEGSSHSGFIGVTCAPTMHSPTNTY
jgi:hypothetical protein